jgi:starch phosphorylase
MKPIQTLSITPSLPPEIEGLRKLAYNVRWAWNHETIELFRRLDNDLWEKSGHNPVLMLGTIDQAQLEEAAKDDGFLTHLARVEQDFDDYIAGKTSWFRLAHANEPGPLVAYFSAEFGLTECLSIFAGGLGVLAGDHMKSASDLGVPLIGVGLLYQEGYFSQYLNEAGWQQENYSDNDFHNLPLMLEQTKDGKPLTVQVAYPGRQITAQIWRVNVGRIPLFLLDTNIAANNADDRRITYQLYGGDLEMRIKQEIMLGIGGFRALEALGLKPVVYHMNEGHSAFLALERIRRLIEENGLSFDEAREAASAGLIFTTHTPVAAGHDNFPPKMMDSYFSDYMKALGLTRQQFLALGKGNPAGDDSFCMTVLALQMAAQSNGVSRLHGKVSRHMWQHLWPEVPEDEIPIRHVTNGVHFLSWIALETKQLYDRYLGPRWRSEPADQKVWGRAKQISNEELWRTHERRRERLVAFARRRLRQQLIRRGAPQQEIEAAYDALDPDALTIGFARRFATYKRATLILQDPERLSRILNSADRPVQIIFAGKAHPKDDPGKQLIQKIVQLASTETFRRRIVFLEDYDMAVARYLVQGSDLWLNSPLRPREASGTSGMKAAANCVLNISVLDGWWEEAYKTEVGWAIGRGETYQDLEYQDQVEAEALYDELERDVVPTFYDRRADGLPRGWIDYMKTSISELCHFFNTNRMVAQYTEEYYLSAAFRYRTLSEDKLARAKALAAWKKNIQANWSKVAIGEVSIDGGRELKVGDKITARAVVELGNLTPDDVTVQLYMGRVNTDDEIVDAEITPMVPVKSKGGSPNKFEVQEIICRKSGLYGFTVRVLPLNMDMVTSFLPGLITWAK